VFYECVSLTAINVDIQKIRTTPVSMGCCTTRTLPN